MANNKPIGIFDSGVGGLTVLKKIVQDLPNEQYIYFGDTARVPYGEKSEEQLLSFSKEILDWYKTLNVKIVLMACNTSSAVTLNKVKNDYDFPIFGLIQPTADYISSLNISRVGVMATSATVNSNAYKKAIIEKSPQIKVFQTGCTGLVEIVESGSINEPQSISLIQDYVETLLKNNVEKIILGCTHYPYLNKVINNISGDQFMLIDPAEFLVKEVKKYLIDKNMLNNQNLSQISYYVSANPNKFVEIGQKLIGKQYLQKAELEFN